MTPKSRRNVTIAAGVVFVLLIVIALRIGIRPPFDQVALIEGAVIAQSESPHSQVPIPNATITAGIDGIRGKSVSESSGRFRLKLEPPVPAGDLVQLKVEHPDYQPFAITTPATNEIYVLRLTPTARKADVEPPTKQVQLSGIRIRYATQARNTAEVGTAVRPFDIANKGNVPCDGKRPCSPDGRWKATIGAISLDTGDANKEFRNVRLSCIAGPCAFSAVESDGFSRGGRVITASVRNWSDPVTYVLEAEVVQTTESELVRYTFPVTFGRSMNFTLPASASVASIEADVDGSQVVFPLGPKLRLSWATCRMETGAEGRQYRCELKPGYTFH